MMLNKMTVRKKITCGFSAILLMLMIIITLSFSGISDIVDNAEEVIYGNVIDGVMAQREIDHLNWANGVNKLLTDDTINSLTVQLEPTKCVFGKWLNSPERKEAEEKIQGLRGILNQIEQPHIQLHKSASKINDVFKQANSKLPGLLAERIIDHLSWSIVIRDSLLSNSESINVEIDSNKCVLGKWMGSPEAKKLLKTESESIVKQWDLLLKQHHRLHHSAQLINDKYKRIHPGLHEGLLVQMMNLREWKNRLSYAIHSNDVALLIHTKEAHTGFEQFIESKQCQLWIKEFDLFSNAISKTSKARLQLHESTGKIIHLLQDTMSGQAKAKEIYINVTLPAVKVIENSFQNILRQEQQFINAQKDCLNQFNTVTLPILKDTVGSLYAIKRFVEEDLEGMEKAVTCYTTQTVPALKRVQVLFKEARTKVRENLMTQEVMLAAAQKTRRNASSVGIVAVIGGILLAILISGSIVNPLKRIIIGMQAGASQVSQVSGQVSSSSQTMAECVSEQASSLEQTSASLEQINVSVSQNANTARQANEMVLEARKIAFDGQGAMKRLAKTINNIKQSSDQTSNILKTIDEIAFQTNLLALNAAVEAARAGEAGKGFAIVAEEVRSLAQRSAQASKTTAKLIADACHHSEQGVKIASETEMSLADITDAVEQVTVLIDAVSKASDGQAQGIDQVTTAVSQMDQVTQSNAASSEESAAASEDLRTQAKELSYMVSDLILMVNG